MLLKDGCGTRCTPFPNLFDINTLHTTIRNVLKWSQSISGVAPMSLARIRMCQNNALNVQNSLQAAPQLQYSSTSKLRSWFRGRVMENKFSAG